MLRKLIFFSGAVLALNSHSLMADTFDDAVNLYLQGFEYCTDAKDALTANNVPRAKAALDKYESLKQEASGINSTILSTQKRGMDSNLKFCERVATDIEIAIGTPILDQALAACDEAKNQLKAQNPEQANISYQRFNRLKQEALSTSPSLNDRFIIRNQIRSCNRLEKKIAGFNEKQEALALAIETVLEESEAYATLCQTTPQTTKPTALNASNLQEIKSAVNAAQKHRAAVMAESLALAEMDKNPDDPGTISKNQYLQAGDLCLQKLNAQLSGLESSLELAQKELDEYNGALKRANSQCGAAQKFPLAQVDQAAYDKARSQYESAIQTRNNVRAALAKNNYYQANQQTGTARSIEKSLGNLNTCLDQTRSHVSALFGALPLSKPPIASVAKQKAAGKTGGVPPRKIHGSVKMLNTTPEFIVAYMVDGSRPLHDVEIVIDASGFDQPVYFVGSGETFRIKSKDFATHRISASSAALDFANNLARVQSRQSRQAKVTWPVNNMVQIRSDRGDVVPSYIANIPSSKPSIIMFDYGSDTVTFELDNPSEAAIGYLLVPDFDPLEIKLSEGEIKSLAITRDNEPLGSVLLKGL